MKSIFLVNPISGHGHLDAYARLYSRALIELGYQVVLVGETDADAPGFLSRNSVLKDGQFSFVSFGQAAAPEQAAQAAASPQATRSQLGTIQRARLVWREEGPAGVLQRLIIVPLGMASSALPSSRYLAWIRNVLSALKRGTFKWLSNYRFAWAIRKFLYPDSGRISFQTMLEQIQKAAPLVNVSRPDLVLFLYLDMMAEGPRTASALNSPGTPPWVGILFHPRLAERPAAEIEQYLQSKNARGGIFLVPAAIAAYAQVTPHLKFALAPDVADLEFADQLPALAQELKHRAAGRKIILQVGSIASHKGIATLLDVIAEADSKRLFFALVGEVHWKSFNAADEMRLRAFYARPPENVHVHEGYLNDERDYNSIVATSDLIYAVYSGFNSSSNSLTKAAGLRRPILVARDTLMGTRVQESRIGLVARQGDSDDILKTLNDLVAMPSDEFDFARYAKEHSLANLKSVLAQALPQWLG